MGVLEVQREQFTEGFEAMASALTEDDAVAVARVQALLQAPIPSVRQRMVEIGQSHLDASMELLATLDPDLAEDPCAVACAASVCQVAAIVHNTPGTCSRCGTSEK